MALGQWLRKWRVSVLCCHWQITLQWGTIAEKQVTTIYSIPMNAYVIFPLRSYADWHNVGSKIDVFAPYNVSRQGFYIEYYGTLITRWVALGS